VIEKAVLTPMIPVGASVPSQATDVSLSPGSLLLAKGHAEHNQGRGKRARSPNIYPDGALYEGPPLAYRLLAAEATDRVAGNARSIGVADAIIV
jgi:hypothetical protein